MDISINLPRGGYISYVENGRKQSLSKKEKREEKECKIFLLEDLQKAMLGGNLLLSKSIFRFAPLPLSLFLLNACILYCLITLAQKFQKIHVSYILTIYLVCLLTLIISLL